MNITEMKKIGLVCATLNNYGSLLQTYALQAKVEESGITPEIIRYKEPLFSIFLRFRNIELAKVAIKKVLLRKVIGIKHKELKKQLEKRASAFEHFKREFLVHPVVCQNRIQLTEQACKYPLVLLGSDQLWHPMNLDMDFFTLTFVPDGVKKAAYAGSFGVSDIPEKMRAAYKKYLDRIEYISCREESGARIVQDLTGRNVPVVCDPAVLMTAEEWTPMLSDKVKPEGKYIFCYFLGNNPPQREYVKALKTKLNCQIVALPHIVEYVDSDEEYADVLLYNVGPSEFMYLIKNAEFVCTDSFHASVFSLQFHKQFIVFDRFENGKGSSTTSRIETLLKVVKYPERLIKNTRKAIEHIDEIKDMDYSQVDNLLGEFRKDSLDYLKTVLGTIMTHE